MVVDERQTSMSAKASPEAKAGTIVAIEGVNGAAVASLARQRIAKVPRARRGGVSRWDASGVFGDLIVGDAEAGRPSARTLLLLYAADLAFRLRWEIRPMLEEGRVVVAAPYVLTATAFGRAAGLPESWVTDLFAFAPPAGETHAVMKAGTLSSLVHAGFVEFGVDQIAPSLNGTTPKQFLARARLCLKKQD
jgi:hypothetical protein